MKVMKRWILMMRIWKSWLDKIKRMNIKCPEEARRRKQRTPLKTIGCSY